MRNPRRLYRPQPQPDAPFDMKAPAPHGYRWELRPAGPEWRLAEGPELTRKCRRPGCQHTATAALRRERRRRKKGAPFGRLICHVWYFYCSDHLYGRVIADGEVMHRMPIPIEPGDQE